MGEPTTDFIFIAITGISTFILAIITGVYAWITNRILKATEHDSEITKANNMASIELTIMRDYARPEVLKAMNVLRAFKTQGQYDNTNEGRKRMNLDFVNLKTEKYSYFNILDNARRLVSHHFQIIYKLFNAGAIDKKTLEDLIEKGQADFYLEIIEPLEGGKNNPNYKNECFNFFGETLYPDLREKYPEMK
jgi:hypothetical protein